MHIEINTAEGIERSQALEDHIHRKLNPVERHHGDRLTRVEVFLKDENADKGGQDKTCTMEARPEGLDPVAVNATDMDVRQAVSDAAGKLERALAQRFGKQEARG